MSLKYLFTSNNTILDPTVRAIRRLWVQNPAAAGNIFLLAHGLEIMKYSPENIFNLSYYQENNNTT
jgi:hypothetical protein